MFFFVMIRRPPSSPLFPSTTLFRSRAGVRAAGGGAVRDPRVPPAARRGRGGPADGLLGRVAQGHGVARGEPAGHAERRRSEEHTSELQSRQYLVCRLLLEKKKSSCR